MSVLQVDGEELALRISERLDRVPHIPTPKEAAELLRGAKKGTYRGDRTKPWVPKTNQVPNGLLPRGR